jgi:hypothetical protein
MFDYWNEELSPEREEALLDDAARAIFKRGLITPSRDGGGQQQHRDHALFSSLVRL